MKNYICINDQKIELTPEQVAQIVAAQGEEKVALSKIPEEKVCKVGNHEMIVLEQAEGVTLLVRKEPLPDDIIFGESNNYDGSDADKVCQQFADEIAQIVGAENILLHDVDLTANDGLKDYGVIKRYASAFTADRQRKYVQTMDKYPVDRFCWLATPWSTPTHDDDRWVLCVSPRGLIYRNRYLDIDFGVRPFCILNSDIFVSK